MNVAEGRELGWKVSVPAGDALDDLSGRCYAALTSIFSLLCER